MKTKFTLIVLFALIMSSCTTPAYLPTSEMIDVNQSGSYIKVIRKSTENMEASVIVNGELIAIDSTNLIVLSGKANKCITVPMNDVKRFELKYAKGKNYGWTIPVFSLASIAHGLFGIITVPVNLIVTILVTASGENAFIYKGKNITNDQLKMFARFPQGIPPNIHLDSIQQSYPLTDENKTSRRKRKNSGPSV